MTTLHIHVPDELLLMVDAPSELEQLAKEALLVRLYALSRISTGRGAALLDISRDEFLELLGRYGISEFDDRMDVVAESDCG